MLHFPLQVTVGGTPRAVAIIVDGLDHDARPQPHEPAFLGPDPDARVVPAKPPPVAAPVVRSGALRPAAAEQILQRRRRPGPMQQRGRGGLGETRPIHAEQAREGRVPRVRGRERV